MVRSAGFVADSVVHESLASEQTRATHSAKLSVKEPERWGATLPLQGNVMNTLPRSSLDKSSAHEEELSVGDPATAADVPSQSTSVATAVASAISATVAMTSSNVASRSQDFFCQGPIAPVYVPIPAMACACASLRGVIDMLFLRWYRRAAGRASIEEWRSCLAGICTDSTGIPVHPLQSD